MNKQRLLVTVFAGLLFLGGARIAAAQHGGGGGGGGHGSGGMGGGGWSGGHGGGSWSGGGGWHGGGNWNGGWHGGNWNGNWHGGWHGSNVGVWFGFPGTWWWPAYYPYGAYPYYGYYGYAGYPYYGGYYGGGYYGGGYSGGGYYGDPGDVVYVQRDTVPAGPSAPAPGMRSGAPVQYSYYCIDPPGYYPQVQQCTRAWLKVVPDNSPQLAPVPQYPQ